MARTLLRIGDLEAGYGDLQVLWSVNFRIDVGECVAVVGANGVGKSTLLKVIAGVLPVMRGAVVFDDEAAVRLDLQTLRCGQIDLGRGLRMSDVFIR